MDLDVPIDPDVSALFKEKPISIEILRSSAALTEYLSTISQLLNSRRIIQAWGSQSINARLDSMLRFLVEGLCAPSLFDILGSLPNLEHAQKILIKSFTLFRMTEELYREAEFDPLETNYYRCHLFFEILSFKSSRLCPVTMMLRQHGDTLLQRLACHLLSVTALNQELLGQIQRVNAQLYNAIEDLGGDGFVFEQCANSELSEQLLVFFDHLSQHAARFIRECRREEIIHCVPSQVRHQLKNQSYQCPGDILQIYNRKYKRFLAQLSLPLQPHSLEDLLQARKDILREKIIVNKLMYPRSVPHCDTASQATVKNKGQIDNGEQSLEDEEEKLREARVFEGWDAMRSEVKKVLVFLLGLDDDAWFADELPAAAATHDNVANKVDTVVPNNDQSSNKYSNNSNNTNDSADATKISVLFSGETSNDNGENNDKHSGNDSSIHTTRDEALRTTTHNHENSNCANENIISETQENTNNDNKGDGDTRVAPISLPSENKEVQHTEDTEEGNKEEKKTRRDTSHKPKRSSQGSRPKLSFFADYSKDTSSNNNINNNNINNNINNNNNINSNNNNSISSSGNSAVSPVPFLLPRSVSLPLGDTLISPITSRHNSVTGCVSGVSQSQFHSPPVSRNNSITVFSCVSPVRRTVSNTSFTSSATTTSQHSFSSLHSTSFPHINSGNVNNNVQRVHSVTTPRDTPRDTQGKGALLSSSHSHSGVATLNEHHAVCHSHFTVSRDTQDTACDTANSDTPQVADTQRVLRDYARHVFQDVLGLVHALLLMATSRTFAGGDGFMLLNDLYGGDGLMFCSNDTVSRQNGPANHRRQDKKVCRDTAPTKEGVSPASECVTTVAITPRGMKIAVPMLYSLFDCDTLANSSVSREQVCPLCVFHCVTTTLLLLNVELMQELETQFQQQQQSLAVLRHSVSTGCVSTGGVSGGVTDCVTGGVRAHSEKNDDEINRVAPLDDTDSTSSLSTCVATHSRSDTLDTVSCHTTNTSTASVSCAEPCVPSSSPATHAPSVPLSALHKAELLLQTLLTRPQQIVHRAVSISPV